MNEREHVIVLDVCCTIKRPTTMCLARKKKKRKKKKRRKNVDDDIRPNVQRMSLKRADRLTIIRIQSKNKEAMFYIYFISLSAFVSFFFSLSKQNRRRN